MGNLLTLYVILMKNLCIIYSFSLQICLSTCFLANVRSNYLTYVLLNVTLQFFYRTPCFFKFSVGAHVHSFIFYNFSQPMLGILQFKVTKGFFRIRRSHFGDPHPRVQLILRFFPRRYFM